MNFIVETSARHIHLTNEHIDILFGKGHKLTNKKDLSQPGQFACEEKVELVGPKGSLKVSVLGPARKDTQVELSFTDARALGLKDVPVRESGDISGTPGIKLVGPCGEIVITEGCIIAKRHIHMTPADAEAFGVKDKDVVKVAIEGTGRAVIFDDVVVRVSTSYALAMHIDTDEANAAAAFGACRGTIVK